MTASHIPEQRYVLLYPDGGDVELTATDDRLELSVVDDAGGWPATRHPTWDDTRGRGLAIVEDVADEWHSTVVGRGKRVTATWTRLVSRSGG